MANKVRFYHLWDWKTAPWFLGIILFVIIILYFPRITDAYRLAKFDSSTIGRVLDIKPINGIRQSKYGSYNSTYSYEVTYTYEANGRMFVNKTLVYASGRSSKNLKTLAKSIDKRVTIYFRYRYPSESTIDLRSLP